MERSVLSAAWAGLAPVLAGGAVAGALLGGSLLPRPSDTVQAVPAPSPHGGLGVAPVPRPGVTVPSGGPLDAQTLPPTVPASVTEVQLRATPPPGATPRPTPARPTPTPAPVSPAAAAQGLTASGIPTRALQAYSAAAGALDAAEPGCRLDWPLLAAIGRVESNHGRFGGSELGVDGRSRPDIVGPALDGHGFALVPDTDHGRLDGDPRFDRAVGPMQFLPGTWAVVGVDADGDGTADPQDLDDAAAAAGRYLCAYGADLADPAQRRAAVLRYNHSTAYADLVLALADDYARGVRPGPLPAGPVTPVRPLPSPSAPLPPASVTTPGGGPAPTGSPAPTPTGTPTPTPTPTPTTPAAAPPAPPAPTSSGTPTAASSPPPSSPPPSSPPPSSPPPSGPPASSPPPTCTPASTPSGSGSPTPTAAPSSIPTSTPTATPTPATTPTPTSSSSPAPSGTPSGSPAPCGTPAG